MKFLRTLALVAFCATMCAEVALAQSPAASQLPWWDYRPERITNDFVTIIGQSGTSEITLARNETWTSSEWNVLTLPFPFTFQRTNYPAGFRIRVAHYGSISFNNPRQTSTGTNATWGGWQPTTRYVGPNPGTRFEQHIRNLMPYWSDLQTSGVRNATGSVYYRTDGVAPTRVLTIEWRVQGGRYPAGNPGNFQAKLFEETSNVEYHYGDNSIDRSLPGLGRQQSFGAMIGSFRFGQRNIGREPQPEDFNNDEDNFLLFVHPDQTIAGRQPGLDTIAITRVNTTGSNGWQPNAFDPVEFAYEEGYRWPNPVSYEASPWWHYSFPEEFGLPIAYRLRPILNDVACDSVWFDSGNEIDAYLANSPVTISARFSNRASATKNNIATRFDVYYGTAKQYVYTSEEQLVSPGMRLGTDNVTFDEIPGVENDRNGIYEVRVYSRDPLEEDFSNDTCTVPYFILGQHDILAFRILQPFEDRPPLNTKYPVGTGVPIEARFLNVGVNDESNVPVGYVIYDGDTPIFSANGIIAGSFGSATFRDANLPQWTPQQPGNYCLKIFANLSNDEDRFNDTIPVIGTHCFTAAYEIELTALGGGNNPECFVSYPVGRDIPVFAGFRNDGITDATNTQATATITDPTGTQVYNEVVTVQNVTAEGGQALATFPDFAPSIASGPGTYTVSYTINNPQDPITANNTFTCTFRVLSQLRGDIFVGNGERFQTIEEARDSLFYLGVSGDVDLILVDDEFTVAPGNQDISNPAIDFRGNIVGAGENAKITWRPHPNKLKVTINLESPSGLGMVFGQLGDENPSGYMTFDGGADRRLEVRLMRTVNGPAANDLAVPFYFGAGSSNYTVRNVSIMPAVGENFLCTQRLSVPTYNTAFNSFTWLGDAQQQISSGIMLRNSIANDPSGTGPAVDTLANQKNVFENNYISGFGFGIASIGAGAILRERTSLFEMIPNSENIYRGNEIEGVSRAGIAVVYEQNSLIHENRIDVVENLCATPKSDDDKTAGASATNDPHAVGIWVSSGDYSPAGNLIGFSSDLSIERNRVSNVMTSAGNAVGIWVETARQTLITRSNEVQQFPLGGSNIDVQNNFTWNYDGANWGAGVAMTTPEGSGGINGDYESTGDDLENNTIYNPASYGVRGPVYGLVASLNGPDIFNNLVVVAPSNATAVRYHVRTPQYEPMNISVASDYNLFWAPNGAIGELARFSPEGFALPSPPVATDLQQWQYLTGLDMNSLVGDVTGEFLSTTPGSIDLRLDPQQTSTLAGNRGRQITELTDDIEREPRTQAAINGRYDIGADEFWGVVRNRDLQAEGMVAPFGYRATSGRFSDAQYVMSDSMVNLIGQVRNLGGLPQTNVPLTLDVSYWNGAAWVPVTSLSTTASADIAEAGNADFGQFMPSTLAELGMSDATFGTMSVNVTPTYRFTLTTPADDEFANNVSMTDVRFYVQRSNTESFVSVESYMPGVDPTTIADPIALGNKLNGDSIVAALTDIRWDRSGTIGGANTYNYDVFERDNWPQYALDFRPWGVVMWMQGEEAGGLLPEERWAVKGQQDAYDEWRRAGLFITGQEVARTHDVTLDAFNGNVADRQFIEEYLRADHIGATSPANYDGMRVQGLRITSGRFEVVTATGVAGDLDPMPAVLRSTGGQGVAQGTHWYVDHDEVTTGGDSISGTTMANLTRASVYYAIDIRHWGRFAPEANRSGTQRVVLGAIGFLDQYGIVLPIELVSFTAEQTGRESVSLNWETANEIDVASMQIERYEVRSTTAGEELVSATLIGEESSRGDATTGAEYALVDANATGGRTYEYRLYSIELDGTRELAGAQRVEIGGAAGMVYDLSILPNEVRTSGEISWSAPRGAEGTIEVLDINGIVVLSQGLTSEGTGVVSIDASRLASGEYKVVLRSGDEQLIETMKIVK